MWPASTTTFSRSCLCQSVILTAVVTALVCTKLSGLFISDAYSASTHDSPSPASHLKKHEFVHDHPDHPWHWVLANPMDPTTGKKRDCKGDTYSDMYQQYHEEGYVVFESCSLQQASSQSILSKVANYTRHINGDRVANMKKKEVKDLAVDQDSLEFLKFIHGGRNVFPFQTLNFPKGTQQPIHSDLIHFDTMPRSLMAATWVALEDMNKDNGPLIFYPKSHRWGTWDYDELGMMHKHPKLDSSSRTTNDLNTTKRAQRIYSNELKTALLSVGLEPKLASDIKRGQTFIWAAGLVHGGSKQNNMKLTRLSQVTHYYFEGAEYYWVPRLSDLTRGEITYSSKSRPMLKSCAASKFGPTPFNSCSKAQIDLFQNNL